MSAHVMCSCGSGKRLPGRSAECADMPDGAEKELQLRLRCVLPWICHGNEGVFKSMDSTAHLVYKPMDSQR